MSGRSRDGDPTNGQPTIRRRMTEWLDGDVKRRQVIGPYVIGALGILAGFWFTADQSDRATARQIEASATTSCLARVDSRAQLRGVFIDLYARLEAEFPESALIGDLRAALDASYPALDPQACATDPFQLTPTPGG